MKGVRPLLDQGWVDPTGTRYGRSRRTARKQTGSSGFGRNFDDRWIITEALAYDYGYHARKAIVSGGVKMGVMVLVQTIFRI